MKVSKLSSLVLTAIFVAGCGVNLQTSNLNSGSENKTQVKSTFKPVLLTKEDISKLDKEYMTFKTKALTISYLQKKLLSLIGNDNGVSKGSTIVKELIYAKEKTESVIPFKAMSNSSPALYAVLVTIPAVINQRAVDIPFDIFMGGTNPYPVSPSGLSVTNITSSSFNANWSAVSGATAYEISVDNGTPINVGNVLTYSITGLSIGSTHTFKVRAIKNDLTGNYSNVYSNIVILPAIPVANAASNITSTGFTANWSTVSDAVSGYVLTIKQGTTTVSTINIPDQGTNSQAITGLNLSTAYTYTLQSKNGSSLSANSNSVSVSTNSTFVSTYAGSGGLFGGNGYQDGNGNFAMFGQPYGMTIDSAGNLYVTEFNNHKIRKIANDIDHTVSTIAGSSQGDQEGNGSSAKFSYPQGITIDSAGNLYVADRNNHKIKKIANDANHTVTTIAGSGTQGYQNGNGTSAQFFYPMGMIIDPAGNLYVADRSNNKIRKIANDANRTVTTIAGSTQGYQDGSGNSAQFYFPTALTIDSIGNLYVADSDNHKIRKVANDANRTVTTYAGSGGNETGYGYLNGNGTSAQFDFPQGITIDPAGNLYISDTGNAKIRKIANDANHSVTTYAGSGGFASGHGYQDGNGTSAQFYDPKELVIDSSGNLYVNDAANNKIRKIQ